MILWFYDNFITFLIMQQTASFVFLTRQIQFMYKSMQSDSHFIHVPNLGFSVCFLPSKLASYLSHQLARYYLRGFIYSMKLFSYGCCFFCTIYYNGAYNSIKVFNLASQIQILENVVTLCLERKQYATLQCITHHKLLAIHKSIFISCPR